MNLREFSAKTSWTQGYKGSQIYWDKLRSFHHCQQESAQNKGQLPDSEMGRKKKKEKKSTDTKPRKTENVVFMQGRNK